MFLQVDNVLAHDVMMPCLCITASLSYHYHYHYLGNDHNQWLLINANHYNCCHILLISDTFDSFVCDFSEIELTFGFHILDNGFGRQRRQSDQKLVLTSHASHEDNSFVNCWDRMTWLECRLTSHSMHSITTISKKLSNQAIASKLVTIIRLVVKLRLRPCLQPIQSNQIYCSEAISTIILIILIGH